MSKPEAGQWWFKNVGSGRVFVVGRRDDGRVVFQGEPEGLLIIDLKGWDNWHHEPRCTGWDWVVPQQPQPAEDPDEWVVQDRVGIRPFKDWFRWSDFESWKQCKTDGSTRRKHGFVTDGGKVLQVRCRPHNLPPVEQPEQWPKYYAPVEKRFSSTGKQVAYYRRDNDREGETFHIDGTSFAFALWNSELVTTREITEAEAMALIKEPEPQPQKTRVRLWIDSGCHVHAGLKGDSDLELFYDHETRQFYTEEPS